jgi:hypothetical protein
VYDHNLQDGTRLPYDGSDYAILNVDGKILFTHEFISDFLHSACHNKMTLNGYWKAKVSTWKQILKAFTQSGNDSASASTFASFKDIICRASMVHTFIDSVFDYLGLLNLDYKAAFSCKCSGKASAYGKQLFIIYDNACKLLQSCMLRIPIAAQHLTCIIDAFHHSGHTHCSPCFNPKFNAAVKGLNSSLNEQKNKLLRNMETSVAFMGQIRAIVYIRLVFEC